MKTIIVAILISLTFIYSQDEENIDVVTKVVTTCSLCNVNSSITSLSLGSTGASYMSPYNDLSLINPASQYVDFNTFSLQANSYNYLNVIDVTNYKISYGTNIYPSSLVWSLDYKKTTDMYMLEIMYHTIYHLANTLSWGYRVSDDLRFSIGFAMNYYQEYAPFVSLRHGEFTYDIGLLIEKDYTVNNNVNFNYSFGYALSNITKEKFIYNDDGLEFECEEDDAPSGYCDKINEAIEFPQNQRYGFSMRIDYEDVLSIRGIIEQHDIINSHYSSPALFGLEIVLLDILFYRMGTSRLPWEDYNQGYGLNLDFERTSFVLNYLKSQDHVEFLFSFRL